jgi:60 kDa SS-A/Ro ribonucleoprotein
MTKALRGYSTRQTLTPANEKIPGSTQVANWGGGFAWEVDDFTKLNRFLILGVEGGTFYASEKKLVKYNGDAVMRCVKSDGLRAVREIVAVSEAGRAPKNDPALFALAIAASHGDEATRKAAFDALPKVARTGTHLLHFVDYAKQFRGEGRGYRNGIGNWFNSKPVGSLAYQMVKYRQRDGWTQRDVLRVAHPKTDEADRNALYQWVVGGTARLAQQEYNLTADGALKLVYAYEQAQAAKDAKTIVKLIRDYNLPREAIPTQYLNDKGVWEALLVDMPMTALIRNLGKLSNIGLLKAGSTVSKNVVAQLGEVERIRKARVHPLAVLVAMKIYQQGHGDKGSLSWDVVRPVVDALDGAFYTSFGNVEKTGKSFLLALDVSGSMSWSNIAGMPGITPAIGSAAMALITAATEPDTEIVAFGSTLKSLDISPRQRLDDVIRRMSGMSFGSTDCSLPMKYATERNMGIDSFVVYTDSETNTGYGHPSQRLVEYRNKTGRKAKLIVVGMVSNGFSIASPDDPGMLDVVGFDTATPNVISAFSAA